MIGMGNATTSETTTYDANGRPVSVTDQHMGAISYTYDAVGNRTSVTDPDGGIQRFVYDELNRLSSVTDPTGGVTSYQYDELNRPIRTTPAQRGKPPAAATMTTPAPAGAHR
jgi:YD repeat-containing protein